MTRTQPVHHERGLHFAVAEYLHLIERSGKIRFFHTPSGEFRHKKTAGILKAMGVRRGVPDFIIFYEDSRGYWSVGAIELKAATGRMTPEQKEWFAFFSKAGFRCEECRSLGEVIEVLEGWLSA